MQGMCVDNRLVLCLLTLREHVLGLNLNNLLPSQLRQRRRLVAKRNESKARVFQRRECEFDSGTKACQIPGYTKKTGYE